MLNALFETANSFDLDNINLNKHFRKYSPTFYSHFNTCKPIFNST